MAGRRCEATPTVIEVRRPASGSVDHFLLNVIFNFMPFSSCSKLNDPFA